MSGKNKNTFKKIIQRSIQSPTIKNIQTHKKESRLSPKITIGKRLAARNNDSIVAALEDFKKGQKTSHAYPVNSVTLSPEQLASITENALNRNRRTAAEEATAVRANAEALRIAAEAKAEVLPCKILGGKKKKGKRKTKKRKRKTKKRRRTKRRRKTRHRTKRRDKKQSAACKMDA